MVWTSPYPPVDPDGPALPELVLAAARSAPGRPALVDGGTGLAVPGGRLAARIEGVAAGLAALGFGPGDVLALQAQNVPPWAGVALGAMRAGGAVTGIPPGATERGGRAAARQDAGERARVRSRAGGRRAPRPRPR